MAVVYEHRSLIDNSVFYIGIGISDKRATSRNSRNLHWKRKVEKEGGFKHNIIFKDLTWNDACEIEKRLISFYGKSIDGGLLVNLTDGGDGLVGYKYTYSQLENKKTAMNSPLVKQKLRDSANRQFQDQKYRKALSDSAKKRISIFNPSKLDYVRAKISEKKLINNPVSSDEVRSKLKLAWLKRRVNGGVDDIRKAQIHSLNSIRKKVLVVYENGNTITYLSQKETLKALSISKYDFTKISQFKKKIHGVKSISYVK